SLAEDKIKAYKNFANKLWNVARFVVTSIQDFDIESTPTLTEKDELYIKDFDEILRDVTNDMENYRFYLAAEKLYHYVWHTFADSIIEESKAIIANGGDAKFSSQYTLITILKKSITALHPFMPFVTEELWSILPHKRDPEFLMVTKWPI
ncbi:MAG: class I tRNA ligase family protein, partial [Chlamydiales bacterium]|nr:class I tRNA ligase family protein [Chlamydiales bacterium]